MQNYSININNREDIGIGIVQRLPRRAVFHSIRPLSGATMLGIALTAICVVVIGDLLLTAMICVEGKRLPATSSLSNVILKSDGGYVVHADFHYWVRGRQHIASEWLGAKDAELLRRSPKAAVRFFDMWPDFNPYVEIDGRSSLAAAQISLAAAFVWFIIALLFWVAPISRIIAEYRLVTTGISTQGVVIGKQVLSGPPNRYLINYQYPVDDGQCTNIYDCYAIVGKEDYIDYRLGDEGMVLFDPKRHSSSVAYKHTVFRV